MLENHEVNDMDIVLDSEMKDLLLTWLFKFGHEVVDVNTAWTYLVYVAQLNYDVDATLIECCKRKYLWSIEPAKGYEYMVNNKYQLLDRGVEFLNGRNNTK